MSNTVLVTGASGYVACHCVKLLLDSGYKVRGTVRNLKDSKKISPLEKLPGAENGLELVEADLCQSEPWKKAVAGCDYVLHVASPFPAGAVSSPETLIRTAKEGSLNVLKAASESGTVKRVVLTSSMLAVSRGHSADRGDKPFTEEDWTVPDGHGVTAYDKSKVLAEKAAWEFMESIKDSSPMELTVLCPGFIIGPLLHKTECASAATIKMLLSGTKNFIPKVSFAFIDVRDVARAHVAAMTAPPAAGKRIIIFNQIEWMEKVAMALSQEFGPQGYKVPTRVAWFLEPWIASFFDGMIRAMLPRVGVELKINNSRMKEILKIQDGAIDPGQSAVDMAYSLIEKGFVPKTLLYSGPK